ncbi:MAG: hypothetical protein ABSF97_09070 [Candidatus Sulfotelmatobacter sp.]
MLIWVAQRFTAAINLPFPKAASAAEGRQTLWGTRKLTTNQLASAPYFSTVG